MSKSEVIVYKGIKFRRYPESRHSSPSRYFRPAPSDVKKGFGELHREIWKDANGEIPDGFHIHHIDGNHLNNTIENLECVSIRCHKDKHIEMGSYATEAVISRLNSIRHLASKWHGTKEGIAWHRKNGSKSWDGRGYKDYTCAECGASFKSRSMGNGHGMPKFCSLKCAERFRHKSGRRKKQKVCEVCSAEFMAVPRQKTCSRRCGRIAGWKKRLNCANS